MTAIIGAVRSWLMVLQPLVIMENTSIEKFALAYCIYSVISGMIGIVCGAAVGKTIKILKFRKKIYIYMCTHARACVQYNYANILLCILQDSLRIGLIATIYIKSLC